MSVTIKDIAKEAGIGTSTVSAYLNGINVRPQNKTAIESAIKKLGYIRNDYARGLKTKKSNTVGVIIPDLSNTFATTIIGAMEEILSKSGYGILVCDYKTTGKSEKETASFLLSKMVDALVVVMPETSDCSFLDIAVNAGLPVVVIDRKISRDDVVQIIINNREVSYTATKSMLERGHKNIGIISGDESIFTACQRRSGYKKALEESGCYNEDYVFNGNLSVDGGYVAMKKLASDFPQVSAVFVTNYEMTIGAIIALNEIGKHIGSDFSFVGFDNFDLAKVVRPRLATVDQPTSEMGKMAAEIILKSIASGENIAQTITLCAKFSEGQSIVKV